MNKLIGILMATYNGEKYISEQIDSILNQTYKNWQLLIHDDGSSDRTVEIVKEYIKTYPEKILLIEDGIKCGGAKENFAHLMQTVKDNFSFDYIMFSDQDDVWLPNKIEVSLKKIKQLEIKWGKDIPLLVYTDLKVVDKNLKLINKSLWKYQKVDPSHNTLNRILLQNIVTGCTMLINRKALDLSLPIPEKAVMHDWWIALVVSVFGKMDYLNIPTVLYRQHGRNDIGAKNWGYFEALKRIFKREEINKFKKNLVDTIWQAEEFLNTYNEKLDKDIRRILQIYSNILNYPNFIRLFYIFKYRLFKNGFLRNLGNIIFMLNLGIKSI